MGTKNHLEREKITPTEDKSFSRKDKEADLERKTLQESPPNMAIRPPELHNTD